MPVQQPSRPTIPPPPHRVHVHVSRLPGMREWKEAAGGRQSARRKVVRRRRFAPASGVGAVKATAR